MSNMMHPNPAHQQWPLTVPPSLNSLTQKDLREQWGFSGRSWTPGAYWLASVIMLSLFILVCIIIGFTVSLTGTEEGLLLLNIIGLTLFLLTPLAFVFSFFLTIAYHVSILNRKHHFPPGTSTATVKKVLLQVKLTLKNNMAAFMGTQNLIGQPFIPAPPPSMSIPASTPQLSSWEQWKLNLSLKMSGIVSPFLDLFGNGMSAAAADVKSSETLHVINTSTNRSDEINMMKQFERKIL